MLYAVNGPTNDDPPVGVTIDLMTNEHYAAIAVWAPENTVHFYLLLLLLLLLLLFVLLLLLLLLFIFFFFLLFLLWCCCSFSSYLSSSYSYYSSSYYTYCILSSYDAMMPDQGYSPYYSIFSCIGRILPINHTYSCHA